MHKTLTSVVALASLAAAAGVAQAEDAVVAGDTMELSLSQMDEVTAGDRVCVVCANFAVVTQNAAAIAMRSNTRSSAITRPRPRPRTTPTSTRISTSSSSTAPLLMAGSPQRGDPA